MTTPKNHPLLSVLQFFLPFPPLGRAKTGRLAVENGARLELLKDGVCDDAEAGRGGTQEEGSCGVAS